MGRVETFGHVLNSPPSMADSCFVSSLMRGIFGRGRFACLVLILISCPIKSWCHCRVLKSGGKTAALQKLRGHGARAVWRKQEFWLGEGLTLVYRGVGVH